MSLADSRFVACVWVYPPRRRFPTFLAMRELTHHPQTPCHAAIRIEAAITRPRPQDLEISFVASGQLSGLIIPPPETPKRADELWRHTCFEVFIGTGRSDYYEFNFAPTTAWAAYLFTSYRSGRVLADISPPKITPRSGADRYALQVSLRLGSLALPEHRLWHLGLSAVIEDKSGCLSYWALVHASDKPDFHRPESFVYEI